MIVVSRRNLLQLGLIILCTNIDRGTACKLFPTMNYRYYLCIRLYSCIAIINTWNRKLCIRIPDRIKEEGADKFEFANLIIQKSWEKKKRKFIRTQKG